MIDIWFSSYDLFLGITNYDLNVHACIESYSDHGLLNKYTHIYSEREGILGRLMRK